MPARLEEKNVEEVDDEGELPVEGISECAAWSEAIFLIVLVVELFKRLRQCCSSRRRRDYAEEVCMQEDEENEHEDDELEDAALEALELKSLDEVDGTKNACLQTEEPQEVAVEAVDAVDQTKDVSLQPKELEKLGVEVSLQTNELEKLGVEAVEQVNQAVKASSESTAKLADVPSPARMTGGTRLRSMKKNSQCPLQRAEALLAEDPQLASEAADCTIPEDEEWDDRAFHQGRSESLATFVTAYKFLKIEVRGLKAKLKQLNDAGLTLQEEVERLMNENRNLEGDIAYWRELAESMSPVKSREVEASESELSEGESPVKGCQLEGAESEQGEEDSLVEGTVSELAEGESPVKDDHLCGAELLDKEEAENQQVEDLGGQEVFDEAGSAVQARLERAGFVVQSRVESELLRSGQEPEALLGFEHGDHIQQDESKFISESANELEQGGSEQVKGQDLGECDEVMGLNEQQIREEHHAKGAVLTEHREDADFFDGDEAEGTQQQVVDRNLIQDANHGDATEGKQQAVDRSLVEDAFQVDLDTDQAQDAQQVESQDGDLARCGEQLGLVDREDSDNFHAEQGCSPKVAVEFDHTLEGGNQQQVTNKDLAENLEEPRLTEQQVTNCEFADHERLARPEGQTSKSNALLGHEKDAGQAEDDVGELDGKF